MEIWREVKKLGGKISKIQPKSSISNPVSSLTGKIPYLFPEYIPLNSVGPNSSQ